MQVVAVGIPEAGGLALLLGKGLDHPDAGNGVGQHIGHFGPHTVNLFKTRAQAVAHQVDEPGNERQGHQRHQRQPRVDGKQNARCHQDHQHIGGKVQQVQRQKHVDAVGFAADAGHQVAGALAPEVLQRQPHQVLVGFGAQVGPDALGHQREDVGFGPPQAPGQQRRAQQAPQVHQHGGLLDGFAGLERNEDVIHQRHGQVRRHQRGGGAGQHQQEPGQQLPLIGFGKPPQAQQRPGGRGLLHLGCKVGSIVRLVRIGILCGDTGRLWAAGCGQLGQHLPELGHQALCMQIDRQGKPPDSQPHTALNQLQHGHTRMVMQHQRHTGLQNMAMRNMQLALPVRLQSQQTLACQQQHGLAGMQMVVKIGDEHCPYGFGWLQCLHGLRLPGRADHGCRRKMVRPGTG